MNKNSFREKVANFMYGRNGIDYLNRFLLGLCFVLLIVNVFAQSVIIYFVELSILGYYTFRSFSRNLVKRQAENAAFYGFFARIKKFLILQKNKIRDRKTHIYCKCPTCKNTLRIPKISGEHTVNCPCCRAKFDIKL